MLDILQLLEHTKEDLAMVPGIWRLLFLLLLSLTYHARDFI